MKEEILLNSHIFQKRLGQSDEAAFGLDKNDVIVEQIPLVYQPMGNVKLTRIKKQHEI